MIVYLEIEHIDGTINGKILKAAHPKHLVFRTAIQNGIKRNAFTQMKVAPKWKILIATFF